jgi:chemotaxis signal transduction protein
MAVSGKWLLCTSGGTKYGLNLTQVVEIIFDPVLTCLPTLKRPVIGVMEWKEREISIITVTDHNISGGTGLAEAGPPPPVILLKAGQDTMGLLVDEAGEIISHKVGSLIEIDPLVNSDVSFLNGAFEYEKELIFVIDSEKLLKIMTA